MASHGVALAYSHASSTVGRAQLTSSPIRIVVGEVPRLLRDIIEDAIAREPDMLLVDRNGDDLEALVRRSGADVAIIADDAPDRDARHRQTLVEHPDLKIFVVADDGREAQLLEFRRRVLSDVSPDALVNAIRAVAGEDA